MKKVGLFYGSDGGATQDVSQRIAKALGDCQVFDVASCKAEDLQGFENLILATPTYGSGDLQDDWDSFLSGLSDDVFANKTIALVGLGDQEIYGDTFANGVFYLYERASRKGKIVGQTSKEGYEFEDSTAVVNGEFVGLIIDEANHDELTDDKIQAWVAQLKSVFA